MSFAGGRAAASSNRSDKRERGSQRRFHILFEHALIPDDDSGRPDCAERALQWVAAMRRSGHRVPPRSPSSGQHIRHRQRHHGAARQAQRPWARRPLRWRSASQRLPRVRLLHQSQPPGSARAAARRMPSSSCRMSSDAITSPAMTFPRSGPRSHPADSGRQSGYSRGIALDLADPLRGRGHPHRGADASAWCPHGSPGRQSEAAFVFAPQSL